VVLVGKLYLIKIPFYEQSISSTILDTYIVKSLSNELIWIPLKHVKKKSNAARKRWPKHSITNYTFRILN